MKFVVLPKARFFKTEISDGSRNFGLDLARFIIVVSVVLFHCNNYLNAFTGVFKILTPMAYVFQELLFALSGFLVGKQLIRYLNEETKLKPADFYKNRWLRTLPFYFFFVLLNALLFYFVYQRSGGFFATTEFSLWKYFACSQNLYLPHPYFFPEIWPIPLEEWSFFIIPLPVFISFWLKRKISVPALIYLLILFALFINGMRTAYVCNARELNTDWDLRKIVLFRLDALVYGFLICLFMKKHADFFRKTKWLFLCIGLMSGFGFYLMKDVLSQKIYQSLLFFILPLSMAITIPWFYYTEFNRVHKKIRSIITHISLISYSVLLMHLYFIQFLMLQFYTPVSFVSGVLFTAIYLLIVIFLSTLFFNYVERPVLLRRKKIL